MKTAKFNKIVLMLFATMFIATLYLPAQKMHDHSKMATVMKTIKIKAPTVQCGMCKKRIEKNMQDVDGVVSTNVDYKKKIITVRYNSEETTPAKIRRAISDIGYQADKVKANKKAYNKLPSCCKVPDNK